MNPLLMRRSLRGRYLLLDTFRGELAAGAVDGTICDTGHKRSVVDTEGKLSTSGGQLVCAGGKAAPAWGDPRILLGAVNAWPRVAGRVLRWGWTITDVTLAIQGGWGTVAAGYFTGNAARIATDAVTVWDSGGLGPVIWVPQDGVAYEMAMPLRAAGCFYMHRVANGVWVLDWPSALNNTANLSAGITSYSAPFTTPDTAIPRALWLPSPLLSDSFSRADGAIGISDGAGHLEATGIGSGGSGRNWVGATYSIASNVATNTPALEAELAVGTLTVGTWYMITATEAAHFYAGCAVGHTFRATATTALDANNKVRPITLASLFATPGGSPVNTIMRGKIASCPAGSEAGVYARCNDPANPTQMVIARQVGGNVMISEMVASSWTGLASVASAFTALDTIVLDLSDSAYRCYKVTNAGVATLISAGTTNVATGAYAGMYCTAGATIAGIVEYAKNGYAVPG